MSTHDPKNTRLADHVRTVRQVKVSEIANPTAFANMRIQPEDPVALRDLRNDIDANGLNNPIDVRPIPATDPRYASGARFEFVCGSRRLSVFRGEQKGDKTPDRWLRIPAYVHADLSDADAIAMNFRENVHRRDTHPAEKARAVFALYEREYNGKGLVLATVIDQIGKRLSIPSNSVKVYLHLGGKPVFARWCDDLSQGRPAPSQRKVVAMAASDNWSELYEEAAREAKLDQEVEEGEAPAAEGGSDGGVATPSRKKGKKSRKGKPRSLKAETILEQIALLEKLKASGFGSAEYAKSAETVLATLRYVIRDPAAPPPSDIIRGVFKQAPPPPKEAGKGKDKGKGKGKEKGSKAS